MEKFKYIILGGGVVAGYAAQEMAEHGLAPGELCILSADTALPYERPSLSKEFLAGEEDESDILINSRAFYADHGIRVDLETTVESVDLEQRYLQTQAGERMAFEKLLIATGSIVRILNLPGTQLDGVHYLRWIDDSRRLRQATQEGADAIVYGGSFIASEVASVLARRGMQTTLAFRGDRLLRHLFTPSMAAFFQDYYTRQGVTLRPETTISAIQGKEHVQGVVLASGQELPADLVVVGAGVQPNTRLFDRSSLHIYDGIWVNEHLETSVPGVYAAGDVTNYQDVILNKRRHLEHWDNAAEQGKVAARNMLGERTIYRRLPYFFSDVFDLSWEFWGDTAEADQVFYRGEVDSGSFSAWWLQRGIVVAAFVMDRPDEEREAAQTWIKNHVQMPAEVLQDEKAPLHVVEQ